MSAVRITDLSSPYLNKVFGPLKPNGATLSGFIDKVW